MSPSSNEYITVLISLANSFSPTSYLELWYLADFCCCRVGWPVCVRDSRELIYTLRTQKGGDVDKKVPRESAREKKIVATT